MIEAVGGPEREDADTDPMAAEDFTREATPPTVEHRRLTGRQPVPARTSVLEDTEKDDPSRIAFERTQAPDGSLPASPASTTALQCGRTIDRYVVLALLGKGGMGEVYAAYDPQLDRKVALKVLHPSLDSEDATLARGRLVREAKAIAQLAHPNVIQVFDVGTVDGDVYFAMEYVDGLDLRDWLRETERSWQEISEVFLAAARGLAAAHAKGLVHRDFKPDNVLVASDGRVRVIDFGIAHRPDETETVTEGPTSGGGGGDLGTRTGTTVGTPAYMAPEQFEGRETDARTDQFNFAVAFYEALYGERPFHGDTFSELYVSVTEGRRRDPPRSSVPSWLRDPLNRALELDPDKRFARTEDLIAALSPPEPLGQRRGVLAVGLAGAVAAAAALAVLFSREEPARCQPDETLVESVWGPERKAQVRRALAEAGAANGEQVFARVEASLDRYAELWLRERVRACEDTAVRRVQSAAQLDLRVDCLDRRLREMDAVVSVLAAADARIVDNAVQAAQSLASVETCANRAVLVGDADDGPRDPERHRVVDALTRVRALDAAGKYEEALELATNARADAQACGWRTGEAQAQYFVGKEQSRLEQDADAEESLFAALRAAEEAGDSATRARVWLSITALTAQNLDQPRRAQRWAQHANLAIEQAGSDLTLVADLHYYLGSAHFDERRFEDAIAELRQASGLYQRLYGEDSWQKAMTVGLIGSALREQNRYEEAAIEHRAALQTLINALGDAHPRVAALHNNLANTLSRLSQFDEAQEHYQRAYDIREAELGPDHPSVSIYLNNLALLEEKRGNFAGARETFDRALAIRQAAYGEAHPAVIRARINDARIRHKLGETAEAITIQREVTSQYGAIYSGGDSRTADAHTRLCYYLREAGRTREAVDSCRSAIAILEVEAPDPRNLAWALTHAALVALAIGDGAEAGELAQRAAAIRSEHPSDAEYEAETELALGGAALVAGDADTAVAHLERARALFNEAPPGSRQLLPQVEESLERARAALK